MWIVLKSSPGDSGGELPDGGAGEPGESGGEHLSVTSRFYHPIFLFSPTNQ